ncbi:helix-hairpin-helix domain-containing protein [Pseudomonas sp. SLFW]|uniref:helix-hairpin-helix domain-containing protein n=1 Tax=Pseudomonas sp. SLFW TaxID=2683259 RepID=UPI0014120079|nr:hypothetical protein [Pseudomonas sp. SLFW]
MTETRIVDLGIEARFTNRLAKAGIHTLEQIAVMSVERLISIQGVGPRTVEIFRHELDRFGIAHSFPKSFVKRYD